MVKMTWILGTMACHLELLITIIYWIFVYNPTSTVLSYQVIMAHGGALPFVWILALGCDNIPIRLKHFVPCWIFLALYIIWTVLQATVFNQALNGNPQVENSDVIYANLDWKNNPLQATILTVIVMLVVVPLLYFVLWIVSLYSFPCGFSGHYRRYISHKQSNQYQQQQGGGNGQGGDDDGVEMVNTPTNVNIYDNP